MPVKRKSAPKKKVPPKSTGRKSVLKKKPPSPDQRMDDLELSLPDELSTPANTIEELNFMIYGPKGIGKTSLAARFLRSLTCQFEPGGKLLKTFQVACPEWIYFKKYIDMLKENPEKYNTLVIDTAGLAYDQCMHYVCQKANIEHPGDEGYGKGWDRVKKEFASTMGYGMQLGMGLIAIAHSVEKEIETKSGRKFNRMCPQLTGQAESYFSGPIDVVGYYHYDGVQRWLQIRGDDYIEAKCRAEENFLTPDGQPIHMIPMGNTPDEAYKNLADAFNNKQKESYAPEEIKRQTKKVKPKKARRGKK